MPRKNKLTMIFGGTFNPPHIGHKAIIEAVLALPETEELIVMPDNLPPHKEVGEDFAGGVDRFNMCRIICRDFSRVSVSDYEINKSGKSYTVDTLEEFKSLYPEKQFGLVIGGDMLSSFDECWYRFEDILKLCTLVVFVRKGENSRIFKDKLNYLTSLGAKIILCEAEIPEASSSEIRNALQSGGIGATLNKEVLEYIKENHLYGQKGN